MDNRGLASECFREALQQDVYCYDSFESLVQHQMLTKDEGNFSYSFYLEVNFNDILILRKL